MVNMNALRQISRVLYGIDSIMGKSSKVDDSLSLDCLRYKQGEGLASVSVSMAKIARPIMARTLREVREQKQKKKIEQ